MLILGHVKSLSSVYDDKHGRNYAATKSYRHKGCHCKTVLHVLRRHNPVHRGTVRCSGEYEP